MEGYTKQFELPVLVGCVAIAGSRVEMALGFLLVGLAGSPRRKPVPGTNTLSRLIRSCETELEKKVGPGPKKDEIKELLKTIDKLREKRNRIVHDLMSINQSVGGLPQDVSYAGFQEIWTWSDKQWRKHQYSVSDIDDVIQQLSDASEQVMTWAFGNLSYWKGKTTDVSQLKGPAASRAGG